MDNIRNKNALITGAASGIGLACAQKLLQNGAKAVAILDFNTSLGQQSAANLEKEFGKGKAFFFPCDVTNTEHFAETFKKACAAMNGLDIVMNNAGMFDDTKWQQTNRLNVDSVIQGTFLAMDFMGKHKGGKGGTIINVASIVALDFFSVCPVYCGSKFNVLAFSRCMEKSCGRHGLRMLTICPGLTSTSLFNDLERKLLDFIDPEDIDQITKLTSQPPEVIGETMVSMVQKAQNGAVWVSEENRPPYAVEFPLVKKTKVNL